MHKNAGEQLFMDSPVEIDKTDKIDEFIKIYFPAFLRILLGKIIVLAPTQYSSVPNRRAGQK